jgi:hypothetical protein
MKREGAYLTHATDDMAPTMPHDGNKLLVGLESLIAAQNIFMRRGAYEDSECDWNEQRASVHDVFS